MESVWWDGTSRMSDGGRCASKGLLWFLLGYDEERLCFGRRIKQQVAMLEARRPEHAAENAIFARRAGVILRSVF